MGYIRTKDGRIEESFDLNINDIKNVENLWCDFHLDNGVLHFADYFPKELKALEIIKEKQVNVYNFVWYHEHHKWMTYEEYCRILDLPEEEGCYDTFELQQFCKWGERLTQQEYELLKEVLL